MSESDFLSATTARLRRVFRARQPSGRKLRLFMAACCRFDLATVTNPDCVALVELAERVADGQATAAALADER